MPDREKVIRHIVAEISIARTCKKDFASVDIDMLSDALALLKEQDELLRKLQKDKDKLCLEVSEWKHKFHDAPPEFVSQGAVALVRWERDIALLQLEQIGKGLGSKMDDVVALLEQQEAVEPTWQQGKAYCGSCGKRIPLKIGARYCHKCGKPILWEGR